MSIECLCDRCVYKYNSPCRDCWRGSKFVEEIRGTCRFDPAYRKCKYDASALIGGKIDIHTYIKNDVESLQEAQKRIMNLKQELNSLCGSKAFVNSKYGLYIKNVIFNPPATIVFWSDDSKTVVKCQEGDEFDPEKGLAMAITKKMFGNKGSYCNQIKKWTDKYWEEQEKITFPMLLPKIDFDGEEFNRLIKSTLNRKYGIEGKY